jgi:hypothetical protein
MLWSLLKNNPGFKNDFIVFHDSDFSDDKKRIDAVYDNIIFMEVDKNRYDKKILFRKSFYKFESFLLNDYDRVISVDADTMCMGDITPLLEYQVTGNIGMAWEYNRSHHNTGLIVIDKQFLNQAFWDDLMSHDYTRNDEVFGTDQRHLVCYCREKNIAGTLPPGFMVLQTETGRIPDGAVEHMIFFHMIHKPLSGRTFWYDDGNSKNELEQWMKYYEELKCV